ncbi:unnamed protein product [Clonostachys solani]|uniref:Ketoreductase domain-containing protein n=1 Tax=Clonostachys solani TaxID=160281 RepID=A0A9P0EMW2_9HYPO|nr:unnamed protein product [Clonostachys solani]
MPASQDVVVPKWVSFTEKWHNKPYEAISPKRPELSAAGKNVVVTGGGTGIGKAAAIAFAQAGAKSVSILGRRLDRLEASKEAILAQAAHPSVIQVLYEVADLKKREEVEAAFSSIVAKVGKLDILVNNAGAMAPPTPAIKYTAESFSSMFETNVTTTLHATQAFVSSAGSAPILINISASLAHIQPMSGMAAYTASKAAQLKLIEYLGAENPQLHTVNLHPGVVATEIGGPGSDLIGQDEVELPGQVSVWLASEEAKFLKSKFVWANWDVEELVNRRESIKSSRLLTVGLDGVEM